MPVSQSSFCLDEDIPSTMDVLTHNSRRQSCTKGGKENYLAYKIDIRLPSLVIGFRLNLLTFKGRRFRLKKRGIWKEEKATTLQIKWKGRVNRHQTRQKKEDNFSPPPPLPSKKGGTTEKRRHARKIGMRGRKTVGQAKKMERDEVCVCVCVCGGGGWQKYRRVLTEKERSCQKNRRV